MPIQNYNGLSAAELLERISQEVDHFEIKAPIDIDAIYKHLGITVDEHADLGNLDTVGAIRRENGQTRVTINLVNNLQEARKRFTMAHELGHGILHLQKQEEFVDGRKQMDRDASYWDSYEFEANSFAAQLLMPMTLLKKEAREIIDLYKSKTKAEKIPRSIFVEEMAEKFAVSRQAMRYRLTNTGLIKP